MQKWNQAHCCLTNNNKLQLDRQKSTLSINLLITDHYVTGTVFGYCGIKHRRNSIKNYKKKIKNFEGKTQRSKNTNSRVWLDIHRFPALLHQTT